MHRHVVFAAGGFICDCMTLWLHTFFVFSLGTQLPTVPLMTTKVVRQTTPNPCEPNPCSNASPCSVAAGGFICDCMTLWLHTFFVFSLGTQLPTVPLMTTKVVRQTTPNPCEPNPCTNASPCSVAAGGFICDCMTLWLHTFFVFSLGTQLPTVPLMTTKVVRQTTPNPCEPNPCANASPCSVAASGFICDCMTLWLHTFFVFSLGTQLPTVPLMTTRVVRQTTPNPCEPNPCANASPCSVAASGFICDCMTLWLHTFFVFSLGTQLPTVPLMTTKVVRQTTPNPCEPNPCANASPCSVAASGFICDCMTLWLHTFFVFSLGTQLPTVPLMTTRVVRQTTPNPCEPNPCANASPCSVASSGFICDCMTLWLHTFFVFSLGTQLPTVPLMTTRVVRQTTPNPCEPNPCANASPCSVAASGFICDCMTLWLHTFFVFSLGTQLPTVPLMTTRVVRQTTPNPCEPNPCTNASPCRVAAGGFICDCRPGFEGKVLVKTCQWTFKLNSYSNASVFFIALSHAHFRFLRSRASYR